jgi:hypothetical protein
MADVNNILQSDDALNEEQLMKYLQDNLSDEERHAVEKQMADSNFVNDAVEGLEKIQHKKDIQQYVNELNNQLHKHTEQKKKRKNKRKLKSLDWLILTVIMVLLLCLIGYYVEKNYIEHYPANKPPVEKKQ